MSRPRILVVQHQDDCPLGWLGDRLGRTCDLDIRRPDRGDSVAFDAPDGVIVLGGSPNAHDDEKAPWLPAVRELYARCLQEQTPTLGICLGMQLLAASVGGRSVTNRYGQQIGVLPLGWTDAASTDPLVGSLPPQGVQWNSDVVVDLPESAVPLARTERGEVQAVRFGPAAWGLQCHPEADARLCAWWVEDDRQQYVERGVDVDGYVEEVRKVEDDLIGAWTPVMDRFAALVARTAESGGDTADADRAASAPA